MNYQSLVGVILYLFVLASSIVLLTLPIYTLSAETKPEKLSVFIDYYATEVCVKISDNVISTNMCFKENEKAILALSIILLILSVFWIIACITGFNRIKNGISVLLFLSAIILIAIITTLDIKLKENQQIIDPASVKFESYTASSITMIVACCLVIIYQIIDLPMVNRLLFNTMKNNFL